jgi:hypothetical protein
VTVPGVARIERRRSPLLVALVAIVAAATLAATTVGVSLALFTGTHGVTANLGTKAIFPGERDTPAFQVGDASSGSEVDRSSPFRLAGDGLTTTTSAWPTAFSAGNYLEFDFNDSLAAGVPVSAGQLDFSFASSGSGQACFYAQVRTISSGSPLATYGSAGSPLGCVTGTTVATFSVPMAAIASTDIANDLRIRLFAADSLGAPMVVDRATVSGSTPYQSFTLYPIVFRDAADGTPTTTPWGLDAP